MFLTRARKARPVQDADKFPATQLFLLALVRVAEPVALTSIFPYAWKLVQHYQIGSEENAAFFAGVLISAFSLAEAGTGMYWGAVSDRIGRKPVLLMGCMGTITSLLVVGLSPNFWVALCGRIIGGLLNGNVGVVQTMVGELVTKPEHEPTAYAVMPFVWSLGTIIGPSIGGCFAQPAQTFPHFFSPTGFFAKFPFVLPNIICASLLVVAILFAYFFLDETHPDKRPRATSSSRRPSLLETPFLHTQAGNDHAPTNLNSECYGTFDQVSTNQEEIWHVRSNGTWVSNSSVSSQEDDKAFTKPVIMFTAALMIFTYHSMTYDHLLPIYLQDQRAPGISVDNYTYTPSSGSGLNPHFAGGLGLSIQEVGIIMSVNGIIALFIQAVVFPPLATLLGIWPLLLLVTVLHPVAYFIVPYLSFLPSHLVYPGIYTALTIRNILSILAYPLLLIMIKEAAPSHRHFGKINGLAASAGAACRAVASPIAGFLYGRAVVLHFTPLAWWASSLVALLGVAQIPWLMAVKREMNDTNVSVGGRGCGAKCEILGKLRGAVQKKKIVRVFVDDSGPEGERSPLIVQPAT